MTMFRIYRQKAGLFSRVVAGCAVIFDGGENLMRDLCGVLGMPIGHDSTASVFGTAYASVEIENGDAEIATSIDFVAGLSSYASTSRLA